MEHQRIFRGHHRVKHRFLENGGEKGFGTKVRVDIAAIYQDLSAIGEEHSSGYVYKSGLAGSVRAYDGYDLAGGYLQRDPPEDFSSGAGFPDVHKFKHNSTLPRSLTVFISVPCLRRPNEDSDDG